MTVEIDYLEDLRGPGIPELDEAPPPPPGAEVDEPAEQAYPGWSEDAIERFLRGTGAGIHMLAGRAEKDWLMTEKDLQRIAPPLTRIANRYQPTLALSPLADPLLVAHGFALYGWRSALEAKRAVRDEEVELADGPGYDRGPAPAQENNNNHHQELDVELEADQYFPGGDSHA